MRKFRYLLLVLIMAVDQLVKWLIRANFEVFESRNFLGSFLSLTYVQNRGVAFSMLSGKGAILVIVPILISALAIFYMEKRKDEHWTLFVSVACIAAGGLGNVVDRLALGFVTDMFDLHWWPVFNVADISICVGCGFLIIYTLAFMDKNKKLEE